MPALRSHTTQRPRVLIAGVGNVLRGDDGFGPAVVRALERDPWLKGESNVRLVELGIGGINLVRELMDVYDVLVIVDLVERSSAAGTVFMLKPMVPEVESLAAHDRHAQSDLHEAAPGRTLLLAQAAGVLPAHVRMIGCQPAETEEFSTCLSPAVSAAVPVAVRAVVNYLSGLREGAPNAQA